MSPLPSPPSCRPSSGCGACQPRRGGGRERIEQVMCAPFPTPSRLDILLGMVGPMVPGSVPDNTVAAQPLCHQGQPALARPAHLPHTDIPLAAHDTGCGGCAQASANPADGIHDVSRAVQSPHEHGEPQPAGPRCHGRGGSYEPWTMGTKRTGMTACWVSSPRCFRSR